MILTDQSNLRQIQSIATATITISTTSQLAQPQALINFGTRFTTIHIIRQCQWQYIIDMWLLYSIYSL